MNNRVLDIIIDFLNGWKSKDDKIELKDENGNYCAISNCHYLLGQIIRNYHVECDHYFISEEAISKWKEITDDPFFDYWYRRPVEVTKDNEVNVLEYVGNSKTGKTTILKKGDKFVFRNVFHDEHMVPIKMILDELFALDNPDYENVKAILNKIYICRMLKKEDRGISNKYNRSTDINEVINSDYKDIKLVRLQSWKQKF